MENFFLCSDFSVASRFLVNLDHPDSGHINFQNNKTFLFTLTFKDNIKLRLMHIKTTSLLAHSRFLEICAYH